MRINTMTRKLDTSAQDVPSSFSYFMAVRAGTLVLFRSGLHSAPFSNVTYAKRIVRLALA